MKQQEYEKLIASYGSKPERWPADKRAAMRAYRAPTGESMRRESMLDALLDSYRPSTPPRLIAALKGDFDAHLRSEAAPTHIIATRGRAGLASLLALAVCFVIGFAAAPMVTRALPNNAPELVMTDPAQTLISTVAFEISRIER